MLTINLKERFRNKTFILAMVGAIVLLIQQLGFKDLIPNNYTDVVNSILTILVMLGIVVDPSTKGINDKIISDVTVQAINQLNETKNEVKTEDSTTGINGVITENSQIGSDDASAISSNKESETNNNNTPVIDPVAIQTENEKLKATLALIQSTAAQV